MRWRRSCTLAGDPMPVFSHESAVFLYVGPQAAGFVRGQTPMRIPDRRNCELVRAFEVYEATRAVCLGSPDRTDGIAVEKFHSSVCNEWFGVAVAKPVEASGAHADHFTVIAGYHLQPNRFRTEVDGD